MGFLWADQLAKVMVSAQARKQHLINNKRWLIAAFHPVVSRLEVFRFTGVQSFLVSLCYFLPSIRNFPSHLDNENKERLSSNLSLSPYVCYEPGFSTQTAALLGGKLGTPGPEGCQLPRSSVRMGILGGSSWNLTALNPQFYRSSRTYFIIRLLNSPCLPASSPL